MTNASDYSSKTCKIQAHRPFHASLIWLENAAVYVMEYSHRGVGEQQFVQRLSLNHRNTFLIPNMAAPNVRIRKCPKCDVTCNISDRPSRYGGVVRICVPWLCVFPRTHIPGHAPRMCSSVCTVGDSVFPFNRDFCFQ